MLQRLAEWFVDGLRIVLEVSCRRLNIGSSLMIIAPGLLADCHFSHPPSRVAVYSGPKPTTYKPKSSPYSATFNNPKNPSIGAWPTEKPTHVSDRLKRFNVVEEGGETVENGGVERIIPGEDKGDKVEIELEDHSAEKAVKEEAVAAVLSA